MSPPRRYLKCGEIPLTRKALIVFFTFILPTAVVAQTSEEKEVETARLEYEQSVPSDNEAARLRYVSKLAEIYYRFLKNYWATGDKSANYVPLINAELKKHPAPKDSDSKKLSELLVGKWRSPRHVYIFSADGRSGTEGNPLNDRWRIEGNKYIDSKTKPTRAYTIILLNAQYFIYTEGKAVFFHARESDGMTPPPIEAASTPMVTADPLVAEKPDEREMEAARQEYEQAVPPGNEDARLTYVGRLAQIADRLVSDYRRSGQRNELMGAINSELKKHPAPKNIDSKKLSQLLVGKWESPRRTYIFRANGKWGSDDGPISSNWRIQDNQFIEDGSRGTIILLNRDYFIYSSKDALLFHSRVKE
jgi:hypothetical protein